MRCGTVYLRRNPRLRSLILVVAALWISAHSTVAQETADSDPFAEDFIFLENGLLRRGAFLIDDAGPQSPSDAVPPPVPPIPPSSPPSLPLGLMTSLPEERPARSTEPDGPMENRPPSFPDKPQDPHAIPASVFQDALQAINTPFDGVNPSLPIAGERYLPFASFAIDSTRPRSQLRLRMNSLFDVARPDRGEFLVRDQKGTGIVSMDRNEFSVYSETAMDRASGWLQLPLVSVHPGGKSTDAGIGNLNVGTKAILLDGDGFFYLGSLHPNDHFYISSWFNTEVPINPRAAEVGLGHGHTTLTPGFLMSYEYSTETMFQSEFKFHIPLGGTPDVAGQVLEYGIGISQVLSSTTLDSTDCRHESLIGTLELQAITFLNGKYSTGAGNQINASGDTAVTLNTGLRYAFNERVDAGICGGYSLNGNPIWGSSLLLEIRWHW